MTTLSWRMNSGSVPLKRHSLSTQKAMLWIPKDMEGRRLSPAQKELGRPPKNQRKEFSELILVRNMVLLFCIKMKQLKSNWIGYPLKAAIWGKKIHYDVDALMFVEKSPSLSCLPYWVWGGGVGVFLFFFFLKVTASNIHTVLIHSDTIQTQGLRETQDCRLLPSPEKFPVKMSVSKADFMCNNHLW